jgi:hypothetical protein
MKTEKQKAADKRCCEYYAEQIRKQKKEKKGKAVGSVINQIIEYRYALDWVNLPNTRSAYVINRKEAMCLAAEVGHIGLYGHNYYSHSNGRDSILSKVSRNRNSGETLYLGIVDGVRVVLEDSKVETKVPVRGSARYEYLKENPHEWD